MGAASDKRYSFTAHCTAISAVQFNKVYLTPFSGSELSQHGRGVR